MAAGNREHELARENAKLKRNVDCLESMLRVEIGMAANAGSAQLSAPLVLDRDHIRRRATPKGTKVATSFGDWIPKAPPVQPKPAALKPQPKTPEQIKADLEEVKASTALLRAEADEKRLALPTSRDEMDAALAMMEATPDLSPKDAIRHVKLGTTHKPTPLTDRLEAELMDRKEKLVRDGTDRANVAGLLRELAEVRAKEKAVNGQEGMNREQMEAALSLIEKSPGMSIAEARAKVMGGPKPERPGGGVSTNPHRE